MINCSVRLGAAVILSLSAAAWWIYGAYLVYSVYPDVTSDLVNAATGEGMHPNFCDAPVYYVTLQFQTLSWVTIIMAALWQVQREHAN